VFSSEVEQLCRSDANELDQHCRSVEQPHDFLRAVQPFYLALFPGSLQGHREWLALRLPVDRVEKFLCPLALVKFSL
jgi:hypothetical protein